MAILTWQTWLALTLVCGMIELFYFNTYTLCLAASAFATMIASIFGVTGAWQLILFAVLAGLLLLLNDKFIKPYLVSLKGGANDDKEAGSENKIG